MNVELLTLEIDARFRSGVCPGLSAIDSPDSDSPDSDSPVPIYIGR